MTSFPVNWNDTMVKPYDEFPLLMPRWGYVVSAFVLFLIGFFGFFLNLMVILLMYKDRQVTMIMLPQLFPPCGKLQGIWDAQLGL